MVITRREFYEQIWVMIESDFDFFSFGYTKEYLEAGHSSGLGIPFSFMIVYLFGTEWSRTA